MNLTNQRLHIQLSEFSNKIKNPVAAHWPPLGSRHEMMIPRSNAISYLVNLGAPGISMQGLAIPDPPPAPSLYCKHHRR